MSSLFDVLMSYHINVVTISRGIGVGRVREVRGKKR